MTRRYGALWSAFFVALGLVWTAAPARAQGTMQVLGPTTAGHLAMYLGRGGQAMDAGGPSIANGPPVNQPNAGTLPTGLGIVNSGTGLCQFTGYASAAYKSFCFGFDGAGNGLFDLQSVGAGAGTPSLGIKIGGTTYPFPGTGTGNVLGPNSSSAGMPALYTDNTGSLLTQTAGTTDVAPGPFAGVANGLIAGTTGRFLSPTYGSGGTTHTTPYYSASASPGIREEYFLNNSAGAGFEWIVGHGITTVVPAGANNKFAGILSEVYSAAGKNFEQMAGIFHSYETANQDDSGAGGGNESIWALVGNGDGGADAGCTTRPQPCARASMPGLETDTRNNWANFWDLVPLTTRFVGIVGIGATSATVANGGGLIAGEGITIKGAGPAGADLVTSLTLVGPIGHGGQTAVTWPSATSTSTTNALVSAVGDFTSALPPYYMYGLNYGEDFSTFGATAAINIQGQSSARESSAAVSVGIRDVGYVHVGIALDSAVVWQDGPANSIAAAPIDILHGAHSKIKEAYYLPSTTAIGWSWQTSGTLLQLCGLSCTNEFFNLDTSNGTMNIAAQPMNWLTSGGSPGQVSGSIAQANLLFSSGVLSDFGIRSPGNIYLGSTAAGTIFSPTVVVAPLYTQFGNQILITNQAGSGVTTPDPGTFSIFMDNADAKLKAKGPSGTVTVLAVP